MPITWKNVVFNDLSDNGAANAVAVGDGISRVGNGLISMGEEKAKKITGQGLAQLAGLTDRDSYAGDAAGIISGLDQRYADMAELTKFQQSRGNILQDRANTDLDMARKQFDNAHMQEMFDVNMAHKRALSGSMTGNSPMHKQAAAYVQSHTSPDGVIDEDAVNAGMVESGLPIKMVNGYIDQFKTGSSYYRQRARETAWEELSIKEQMKSRAKNDQAARKFVEAPENIGASYMDLELDSGAKARWSKFYHALRDTGRSDRQAREDMEPGMNYEMWGEDQWDETPELTTLLSDFQAAKKARNSVKPKLPPR